LGRRQWSGGVGPGSLAKEGGLYLNICALSSYYATADGAGLPV